MGHKLLNRCIEDAVRRAVGFHPAVALIGARRVGKTTLAKKLASEAPSVYLDLEIPQHRECLGEDPVGWLTSHLGKLVVIDEVQKIPYLFESIRVSVDHERRRGHGAGKFLLVSSADDQLMGQTSETLAGRAAYLNMHGLNMLEAGEAFDMQLLWDRGMYPTSLLAASDTESYAWRSQYLNSKMLNTLFDMGSKVPAKHVVAAYKGIANAQGEEMDMREMCRKLNVYRPTLQLCCEILEDMMLVRKLLAFDYRFGRHDLLPVRYYCCDSGLWHTVKKTNPKHIDGRSPEAMRRASWAGFVIENIASVMDKNWNLYYYSGAEWRTIDLIVGLAYDKHWAIEIQLENEHPTLSQAMREAIETVKPEKAFVVYRGDAVRELSSSVVALPLRDMLKEFWSQNRHSRSEGAMTWPCSTWSVDAEQIEVSITGEDPNLPLMREKYLEPIRTEIEKLIQEYMGLDDKDTQRQWGEARGHLLHPFSIEIHMRDFDPDRDGFFLAMTSLLEWLLSQKENEAGKGNMPHKGAGLAGLCAYDLFVSFVSVLLECGQYSIVHRLLSASFNCGSSRHGYSAFWHASPRPAAQQTKQAASTFTERQNASFIDAELIVMLYSLLFASRSGDIGALWYPHVFWNAEEEIPTFFVRATVPKGLQNLLACVGEKDSSYLLGCLEKHYEQLLDNAPSHRTSPGEHLRKKLNVAKWGSHA